MTTQAEHSRANYLANRARYSEARRQRRQDPAYRQRELERDRQRRAATAKPRDTAAATRYAWLRRLEVLGLTEADYDRMLEEQGGRCALCETDRPWERSDKWAVDHDHATGRVRALLCHVCNKALGLFRDDPERLRAAAVYVERHRQLELVGATP